MEPRRTETRALPFTEGITMGKIGEASLSRWAHLLFAVAAWSMSNTASGWIYPEHRDIAVLAVEGLDPERKAEFDRLWQEARVGDEAASLRAGRRRRAGRHARVHRLGGAVGDRRRSFVLEPGDARDRSRSRSGFSQVADVAAQLKVDLARDPGHRDRRTRPLALPDVIGRRTTTPGGRSESRQASERPARGRHPNAARRSRSMRAGRIPISPIFCSPVLTRAWTRSPTRNWRYDRGRSSTHQASMSGFT